ncbi:MAG TPA: type II toxin-antitoxin system Phd/YefM family antitoxin [Granulicella sp.]
MKAAASNPNVRTIAAGEFKAKCLQLMDDVNEKKLTLIITKRGKPVAELKPPTEEADTFRPLWGRTPNVKILGDIMAPMDWGDPVAKWKKANKRKKVK